MVRARAICSFYHLVRHRYIQLISGNNYGLGDTRKKELLEACKTLGVTRDDRCVVLDHKYTLSICLTENRLLQDNPKVWWDTDLVAKTVEEYVKKWKIDAIITFDDGGVSGHINHRAVSAGVRFLPFSLFDSN